MESQSTPSQVQSQQGNAAELAGRIGAKPQPPAPEVAQELNKADEAHSQALKNLGEVASGQPITTDMNGNILGAQDQQELRDKGLAGVK